MQAARGKTDGLGRKAKLASSYQELLDEFASKDLKSVGNYSLGRLIGKGSFGKVYLATHKLTNGSKVVLKSANKGDSNLAREIHHHRQFVHPHIARLYEVIVTENLVWLVLEYCAGDELYNYLLQHGPLPVPKVQKIFAQLVGAVSYVHQQSCVHRDLKLENILFDKNEEVKLVDFGFTREYEGRTNYLQTFCGTICYSAPEMLKGERYAGEKVDVWSLGIILYALLCGELPFDDDDDNITRTKILTADPVFPEQVPPDAVALIKSLLSKRPLLRPTLPDVLAHPFIADHAPLQAVILQIKQAAPFATPLEKDCLQRMRSAGVDIDSVIESVIAQKCDALSGWWTLLLEKEERKQIRRDAKRRDRDAENKSLRRLSAASSRLDRLALQLQDVDEDGGLTKQFISTSGSRNRGRSQRRSAHYNTDFNVRDMPQLAEGAIGSPTPDEAPPTPIDKDSIRSVSSSRHRRPVPPPKEGLIRSARSRGSTLHLVTTSDALASTESSVSQNPNGQPKPKRKPSQAILAHWKNWTHWIFENTAKRRGRWHDKRTRSTPDFHNKEGSGGKDGKGTNSPRPQTNPDSDLANVQTTASLPKGVVANGHSGKTNQTSSLQAQQTRTLQQPVQLHTSMSRYQPQQHTPKIGTGTRSYKRQSLSPSPITPRSSMRRSSAGLKGRKSTSSSVSSVRSIHRHRPSHSKASSTSSAGSVSAVKTPHHHRGASPHHSVKVLPATPTTSSFPSSIRLVRAAPAPLNFYNEGMPSVDGAPGSPNPFASGVMFAKRKKNIFKGPTMNYGNADRPSSSARSSGGHSRSASGSGLGRRSGEITIQEEDEDGVQEEIEEVESFAPIVRRPGEKITEEIIEDEEEMPQTPTPLEKTMSLGSEKPRIELAEQQTPTAARVEV